MQLSTKLVIKQILWELVSDFPTSGYLFYKKDKLWEYLWG